MPSRKNGGWDNGGWRTVKRSQMLPDELEYLGMKPECNTEMVLSR